MSSILQIETAQTQEQRFQSINSDFTSQLIHNKKELDNLSLLELSSKLKNVEQKLIYKVSELTLVKDQLSLHEKSTEDHDQLSMIYQELEQQKTLINENSQSTLSMIDGAQAQLHLSQRILRANSNNRVIPLIQVKQTFDELNVCQKNLKSMFTLTASDLLSDDQVETMSIKPLKSFYESLDRVLKQNQIIETSSSSGQQEQNERIRNILKLCQKIQYKLLKDETQGANIREMIEQIKSEVISISQTGLDEILEEHLEQFQKQIADIKNNITEYYNEKIQKLNEKLYKRGHEGSLDDELKAEKIKQLVIIANELLKTEESNNQTLIFQQPTALPQQEISILDQKETPTPQIELEESKTETPHTPSGFDPYQSVDIMTPNDNSQLKDKENLKGNFLADRELKADGFDDDRAVAEINRQIIVNQAQVNEQFIEFDARSRPAQIQLKSMQPTANGELEEVGTPIENEISKTLSTGNKVINIMKESQENNPISNLPSESPQGDFDVQALIESASTPQTEEQKVEFFITQETDVQKNSIFELNKKHLQEIQSQGEIQNIRNLIEYLSNKYKTDAIKEQKKDLKISDLLIREQDGELKPVWEKFLKTWNAQTHDQAQQQPILFDDAALLSYFISIDDKEKFLSIEASLRLLNFLETPHYNKNNNEDQKELLQEKNVIQHKQYDTSNDQQYPTASSNLHAVSQEQSFSLNESSIMPYSMKSSMFISELQQSISEGDPSIEPLLDNPELQLEDGNIEFVQQRVFKSATLDSDNLYLLNKFLVMLEIENSKPRSRKITSLREMLNVANNPIPNGDLKSYMKQFNQYAKDVLFGDNKERKLHQIQIEWAPFSDELLISMVLALSDKLPSKAYGEAIITEIGRLETIGESIMEHLYVVYAITYPANLSLHFNDLENLRIQTLKITNLSELAKIFYLDTKLLTNEQKQSEAPKRELSAIVNSIVGALGLWAGIEPVIHFLQLLNVIQKDKNKKKDGSDVSQSQNYKIKKKDDEEEVKEEIGGFSDSSDEEEEVPSIFKEKKGEESEKNIDDIVENIISDEERDARYFHSNQDYLIPQQLYEYCRRLTTSAEVKQIMKAVPHIDEIEKKVAMIITSNESTGLINKQDIIYKLALFDSSFNDYLFMEAEVEKINEFLRGNLSNLKLKMIGQSFISMMFKVRMYYETADVTTELEFKSAKHIDAQICQIMLASWHCYGITNKFVQVSSQNGNLIPIVISQKSKYLMDKIAEYEQLVRPAYIIPANEHAIRDFDKSNASTQASSSYNLKTYTFNSKDFSKLYQDGKKDKPYRQFFSSKPQDKMIDIAENFIPEYATILQALIGAKFIQSIGNLKETSQLAQYLLMHNKDHRFPVFKEMQLFYSDLWNLNPYSRILKLHYSVEHIKGPEKMLYYKVYMQTLEIRRVKFKASHSSRHQRIFKDVQQYIEVGNKVFQEYQKKIKFPLSPYEYITFHQEYRKIYKVGASADILFKSMEPFYSKRKLQENNPFQRIQTFLTNIKRMNEIKKVSFHFSTTQKVIELLANQIEADLKNNKCKAIDNVMTGSKDLQIMEYIDEAIYQLIEQRKQSDNQTKDEQEAKEIAYQIIFEQLSKEMNITRSTHGHLFNTQDVVSSLSSETFSSRKLFAAQSSIEDILRLIENISEQYPW